MSQIAKRVAGRRRARVRPRNTLAMLTTCALALLLALPSAPQDAAPDPAKPEARYPGPISKETLAIVRNAQQVLVYTYPERIGGLNPHKDHSLVRRVTDARLIRRFRGLLEQNAEFQPNYRKRCLPVYDYGLEFRAGEERRTFLFSFRCNSMKIHEDNIYRDFERERIELYALLRYEVNDRTSE